MGEVLILAVLQQLVIGIHAVQWAWVTTFLACTFIVLALARQRWCWLFAALSAALAMQSGWREGALEPLLLNALYIAMAVYGWWRWWRESVIWPRRLSSAGRVYLLAGLCALTLLCGFWAHYYALARHAYAEAFILCSTLMFIGLLAYRYIESWHCLLLTELASVMLALNDGAQSSAALHCWYLALALVGISWWSSLMAVPVSSGADRH